MGILSKITRGNRMAALAVAASVAAVSPALGTTLTPGQGAAPTGEVLPAGAVVGATTGTFVGGGVVGHTLFSGTVTERVYRETTTGTLDFLFDLSNNATFKCHSYFS